MPGRVGLEKLRAVSGRAWLAVGALAALVLLGAVMWMTRPVDDEGDTRAGLDTSGTPRDHSDGAQDATPEPSSVSSTAADGPTAQVVRQGEEEAAGEPDGLQVPVDLAEQMEPWVVHHLEPIPATSDALGYARGFASVWLGPSPALYDYEAYQSWLDAELVANTVDEALTQEARHSIFRQQYTDAEWAAGKAQHLVQGVDVLAAERPEWLYSSPTGSRLAREVETAGWPGVEFVEVWAIIYTRTGSADGGPFITADYGRALLGVVCDPQCGLGDVLTEMVGQLGGADYRHPVLDGGDR